MMGRKRKETNFESGSKANTGNKYDQEETFNDSEDDFYAGRDKILIDEGPAAKRRRRMVEREKDLQPSDEEILRYDDSDEDDFDDARSVQDSTAKSDEDEDERVWGTTKADYYNADTIETEADALEEEAEARRLQQKQLKAMTNADFGFDETQWTQPEKGNPRVGPVVEKLPEVEIPAKATRDDKIKILDGRYPEFNLLAQDLARLQEKWQQLQQRARVAPPSAIGVTAMTKLRILTSYLGAITMYFAVVSSKPNPDAGTLNITALAPSELREHAIIDSLMVAKQTWEAVKDLEEATAAAEVVTTTNGGDERLAGLKKEHELSVEKTRKKRPRKEAAEEIRSDSEDDIELDALAPIPNMKPKQEKSKLVDLQALLAQTASTSAEQESDFGDEAPLTEEQAAEKAKRKKSLRFYASQIAQKANKRGAASRGAGGDDDVPRKERLRDQQERLLEEAEKRGQQRATGKEQLGGGGGDDDDDDDSEAAASADGDDYYQSLVTNSQRKKTEKQARAAAYAEAAKQGGQVVEEQVIGTDGKRRITYAIEKNKGLTPKRNKDVRNPRVKKRKKYDEKLKKLNSIRQVYKGGEGRGGYGGELTGIKSNLVKSTRL